MYFFSTLASTSGGKVGMMIGGEARVKSKYYGNALGYLSDGYIEIKLRFGKVSGIGEEDTRLCGCRHTHCAASVEMSESMKIIW